MNVQQTMNDNDPFLDVNETLVKIDIPESQNEERLTAKQCNYYLALVIRTEPF